MKLYAWNSLMALPMLVDQAELNDHGVILEYQLGNTSRRLDAMLTGHSPTSVEKAVVVELKQWSDGSIGPSTAGGGVSTTFQVRVLGPEPIVTFASPEPW